MSEAPHGLCWLCSKYRKLTKEHIPPEKAFNNHPLLYQKVVERSRQTGVMEWEPSAKQQGLYFRSLCEECNNRAGRLYGSAYVDLVRRVAEKIGDVQDFHKIYLPDIKRPVAILKQIIMQFVTANGQNFVRSNPWVAPFVRSARNSEFPSNVFVYLFGSNSRLSRKSGVSAFADADGKYVISEFTFWPLGTILSFDKELIHKTVVPIHNWAKYAFDFTGTVDLWLPVNPVSTAYPLDFRNDAQRQKDAVKTADPGTKMPSEEDMDTLMKKAQVISGETNKDSWIYSGHPSTFELLKDKLKER